MRTARAGLVGGIAAAMAGVYGLLVASQLQLIDHIGFRDTASRMRSGQGFYTAYLDAFEEGFATRIGEVRGIRAPTIFLVWRWIPDDGLYLAYLGLVVVLTAVLLAAAVPERSFTALVPAGYLLLAGRSLDAPHVDAWLLPELWAVPAIAGAILAYRRGHDAVAVGCVVLAVLIREVALVALIVGLGVAIITRRPLRPWVAGAAAAGAAWAAHVSTASDEIVASSGGVAGLRGSRRFPETVLDMMAWNAPEPAHLFAVVAFGGAALALWRRRDLLIAALTLPIPVYGIVVERSYWGILAVPFAWWLTAIVAADTVAHERTRRRYVHRDGRNRAEVGRSAPPTTG